jgi:hypothetical protein
MTNLGVILDSKLSFREHIDSVVKRLSRVFRDPYKLKVLYVTYVRSKLEYANCVWQSFYVTHTNRIERIQEKFWNVNLDLPPYEDRCRVLVMNTLKKRRDVARVMLVFDLLQEFIFLFVNGQLTVNVLILKNRVLNSRSSFVSRL